VIPVWREEMVAVNKATSSRGARRREHGAAAVEFALLLPLLMLLLFGIVEFGLALHRQQVLATASREGARVGIRQTAPRPTSGDIERAARNVLTQAGVAGAVVAVAGAGGASGTDLRVDVELPHRFFVLPNLAPGIAASVRLRSRTVMKHE
jgi:Flp pilus assembly protein TadG